jgi:hypothetical protein
MNDFFNFDEIDSTSDKLPIEVETITPKKLDIFKTLAAIDKKHTNFLNTITEQERKTFAPIVVMQWMSGLLDSNDNAEINLRLINELVNMNFWELYQHPELQYKLMTLCSDGKVYKRNWIPMATKESKHFIIRYMYDKLPYASDKELEMCIKKLSFAEIDNILLSYATDNETQQKVIESYAKLTNQPMPKKSRKKQDR